MPNTSSAKKALRQGEKKKTFNLRRKNNYKSTVKEFRKSIESNAIDKATLLLPKVFQALDKAAKGNTIKKNKASRLKSRLSSHLSSKTVAK